MSTSQQSPPPGEGPTAQQPPGPPRSVAAVRAAGLAGLADLLADDGFILESIATDPRRLFEVGTQERAVFTNLLATIQEARSALDALEARTVVALGKATTRDLIAAARDSTAHEDAVLPPMERINRQSDAATRRDLSLMTRRSPATAGRTFSAARRMVASMPEMLSAMGSGKVTAQVAYATADAMSPIDEDQRKTVDAILGERLPDLDGAGVRQWRREVAAVAEHIDPDGTTYRHTKARKERCVTFTPGEHGMATVSARLPAIDARLVHKRLSLEAERRRAEADGTLSPGENHSTLMADAFTETLLRREGGMEPVTLDVGVMITDRALFNSDCGDAAQIEGYGPVPAEAVRAQLRAALAEPRQPADLAGPGQEPPDTASIDRDPLGPDGPALRAVIRRLYTHPTSGELVGVESRAREFPPAMRRFLSWRDTSCRGPFCNAAARQRDHITPHAEGGPTSIDNGQDVCAHCNQKEHDTRSVVRTADPERPGHRVTWTGMAGTSRTTTPSPLAPLQSLPVPTVGADGADGDGGDGEDGGDNAEGGSGAKSGNGAERGHGAKSGNGAERGHGAKSGNGAERGHGAKSGNTVPADRGSGPTASGNQRSQPSPGDVTAAYEALHRAGLFDPERPAPRKRRKPRGRRARQDRANRQERGERRSRRDRRESAER